jgi:hypothetical protein
VLGKKIQATLKTGKLRNKKYVEKHTRYREISLSQADACTESSSRPPSYLPKTVICHLQVEKK